MSKVITISREFGSGGREIGVCLAKKLGIHVYDKELIAMAAEDSNISEDLLKHIPKCLINIFLHYLCQLKQSNHL